MSRRQGLSKKECPELRQTLKGTRTMEVCGDARQARATEKCLHFVPNYTFNSEKELEKRS